MLSFPAVAGGFACPIDMDNCSHICVRLSGINQCDCYAGYELAEDEVTCDGKFRQFYSLVLQRNREVG